MIKLERKTLMDRPEKSFTERISRDQTRMPRRNIDAGEVFLVRGKDSSGRQAWYYVRVPRTRAAIFERKESSDSLNLNDWGQILLSGFGDSPPASAKQKAWEEFGFREGS